MKKKLFTIFVLVFMLFFVVTLVACGSNNNQGGNPNGPGFGEVDPPNGDPGEPNGTTVEEFFNEGDSETDGTAITNDPTEEELENPFGDSDIEENIPEEGSVEGLEIKCSSGTSDAYTIEDGVLKFSGITENSVYSLSGIFNGVVVSDVGEDYKFELELTGVTIISTVDAPIQILSGDKVTISAKKGTVNYVYDNRETEVADEEIGSAIYALCDLDIQGKGTLNVISKNNNGIHTKDDLNIKNLTLNVDCLDNALKGNDSVTIKSGTLTLIARSGDGIKTSNSDISSKGNQRGTVTITGGEINIFAACDGIDASYNVLINESEATVNLNIYTDKYSSYSNEVTAVSSSKYYLRALISTYNYAVKYYNSDTDYVWANATFYKEVRSGKSTYYYYTVEKKSEYKYFYVYMYTTSQTQGQDSEYYAVSTNKALTDFYDTIALNYRNETLSISWTNYTTTQGGFGPGGMQEGNPDKGDHSTKAIKADNEIVIDGGNITLVSYDDAIHANNDNELENGETPLGNITINGGVLNIRSNDDGVHADGTLLINGGVITVSKSYEGLEGNEVIINDGTISVIASDDGVNGKSTLKEAIAINGGEIFVYSGGDGLDSNSQVSYDGILFSGGKTVVISTGNADSPIDSERGYKYTAGYVLAIGKSGGMSNESTKVSNLSSIGKSQTMSLTQNTYLTVSDYVVLKVPVSQNSLVIFLGDKNATINTVSTTDSELNSNGVTWLKD